MLTALTVSLTVKRPFFTTSFLIPSRKKIYSQNFEAKHDGKTEAKILVTSKRTFVWNNVTMLQYYSPGILVPAKWANQDTSGRERPPDGLPNISPDIRGQRKYEIVFPKPLENEWT